MKIQPAVTDLSFTIPAAGGASGSALSYIDTARELSKINRRLYSQSRMYAFQGLTFIWRANGTAPTDLHTLELSVRTAGNTWIVQNAHVKGHALWNQMNQLVLEDNPSIQGKWNDFKVQLCDDQTTNRELGVLDGHGASVKGGDWNISTYVMPQHDVDPVTGNPLPADQKTALLIGPDTGTKVSLVQAYQESRATVQPVDPNVPAGLSTSFFNLLTDSGSQEPELADVIEDANETPPYDVDEYPGSSTNAPSALTAGYAAISSAEVDGRVGSFVAPCGLLEIEINGFKADGTAVAVADMPAIDILLHVAPGMYKGVASVPMGQ